MQLKAINSKYLIGDLSAGVLVALVGIPQCLAYSMLAGLPPMYGLATAAVPGMIAAVLGRSAFITVGPTNTTGLIILSALAPFAVFGSESLLIAMAVLTLMAGLVRLAISLSRSERIFDFIPEAVMVGFATGAAIIIALMQIDEFVGLDFGVVNGALGQLIALLSADWTTVSVPTLLLAAGMLTLVQLGRFWMPSVPIPLLLLLASLALVYFFDHPWIDELILLGEYTLVSSGWPEGYIPLVNPEVYQQLILPAFAVAFIGSLELIVILRKNSETELLSKEIKSQGVSNVLGAFFSAFPASTSLTRSVMLQQSGAKTRLAPFLAAAALVPLVFWGKETIELIPQAVISALLMATAISMINRQQIKQMLSGNNETRTLFLITLLATLLLKFYEAIFLGVLFGIGIFLYQASRPRLKLYGVSEGGVVTFNGQPKGIIEISGSLFFAAAKGLPNRIQALSERWPTEIVIDISHCHQMRVASVQALQQVTENLQNQGSKVWITGMSEEQKSLMLSFAPELPLTEQWRVVPRLIEYGPD